ncbi:MAG: hypothetical protein HY532_00540 [Chloroflexi bacterium]|nr:hypothetical protein [Chloroflexota bacterium]
MADVQAIPSMGRVKSAGGQALSGILGGVSVSLGARILGPAMGQFVGGILAGAAVGGEDGRVVTINAVMDGTISWLSRAQ